MGGTRFAGVFPLCARFLRCSGPRLPAELQARPPRTILCRCCGGARLARIRWPRRAPALSQEPKHTDDGRAPFFLSIEVSSVPSLRLTDLDADRQLLALEGVSLLVFTSEGCASCRWARRHLPRWTCPSSACAGWTPAAMAAWWELLRRLSPAGPVHGPRRPLPWRTERSAAPGSLAVRCWRVDRFT